MNQRGPRNPNWKGGISKDNMHYKRLQRQRYPERVYARELVRRAVKAGRLVRQPCERCGEAKSFGHHKDYSKPLVVRWLCRPCHKAEHDNHPHPRMFVWRGKARPLGNGTKNSVTRRVNGSHGRKQPPTKGK